MDGLGDELLAHPALSLDEHVDLAVARLVNELEDILHRTGIRNDILESDGRFQRVLQDVTNKPNTSG